MKSKKKSVYYLEEVCIRSKDTGRLKLFKCKKIYHANTNHKNTRVDILIPDRANYRKGILCKETHFL